MKYCSNCGTKLSDDAIFCEECGTKQNDITAESANVQSPEQQQTFSVTTNTPSKKNNTLKCLIIAIAIVLIIVIIRGCQSSNSPEDIASDFAESLMIDFEAKKVVSLMSEELVDSYMEQMNLSSKKELIARLDDTLEVRKEDTIGYYGDDWRAKIIDVELQSLEDDMCIVVVSISHKGSEALWNTNIDELRVYLVNENGEWRVYDFQG